MAKGQVNSPTDVVERNISLVGEILEYLINQPHLLNELPEEFELVILPDDEPEMRIYNLDLINQYSSTEKPIVFARIKSSQIPISKQARPSLYIPLAM